MALTQVTGPYPIFTDLDGTPLDDGYLYIGEINEDPETNPILVYWDSALTIVATQPIRTSNGYAYRNGSPALLYTAGEFSITIRNKRQEFVLYSPVGYGFDPAAVSASVVKNDFVGDGVEVDFTLSASPSTKLATNIFINGVYQEKDSYSLLGNVITFSIAPPLNSSIEVMTNETGVINAGNATAISYTASFPGATAQTVQTKLEQYVSVKDFGAVGDGVADDTAAMQAAHDTGNVVYYPSGTYKFTTLTNITSGGIVGDGQTQSVLRSTDTTSANLITFTGASVGGPGNSLTFRDFMLEGQVPTKTAGAGIRIAPASGENVYAYASNVTLNYVPIGFDFVRASFFSLISCKFLAYNVAGVQVANADANDAGDSSIIGCAFNCPYNGGSLPAGIKHLSSGGLRIIGNKFLGGNYGYYLAYTDSEGLGNNTSVLFISNNSIENFHTNAIALTKVSAGLSSYKNIVIADNEIAVALATPSAFLIASDSGTWLQNVTITGNVMQLPGVTNSYGIVMTGVTCLNITGNTFRGNGGTSQALGLTSCVDVKIGTNVYSNITEPYVLTTPGANNSVVFDSQSGTAATSSSGWAAYYGSLYIGPVTTVTFSQPFQKTPEASDVMFSLASGDGSVGVIVVAVTKTQLQFAVIASRTPGFVATVNWKVWGVL